MLTNSARSLRVLGTINGLATSVSAVGRAAGPAISGGLFTWGVKRGYIIVPFWALSVIAAVAAVPTWWLVEGSGFGEDDDVDDEAAETRTADLAPTSPRPIPVDDDEESHFGDLGPEIMSYTSTRRSSTVASGSLYDDEDERAEVDLERSGRRGAGVRRRSSVPIGMGRGFRRWSSNLGSTGVGAAGASWGGT
jgi:hypothetical protein